MPFPGSPELFEPCRSAVVTMSIIGTPMTSSNLLFHFFSWTLGEINNLNTCWRLNF